jgi:predicted SAM-dependent methyltransferase
MKSLKYVLRQLGLYDQTSRTWIWLRPWLARIWWACTGKNQRLSRQYLNTLGTKKLHVGCGPHQMPGWLNADLCPSGEQIRLDATRRFPFEDGVFDFIYSEHMIEHVPWSGGMKMLRECFRVLKPGGIIRIATPDLKFLLRLLQPEQSPVESDYLRYNHERWTPWAPDQSGVYAVNHFMRAWGHQFIFDKASLGKALMLAGFEAVSFPLLMESKHDELRGLAAVDRMPDGFLELETLVAEAVKPQSI